MLGNMRVSAHPFDWIVISHTVVELFVPTLMVVDVILHK